MNPFSTRRVIPLCVLSAVCCVLSASAFAAEVPHLIRYQGQATDAQGIPLEGAYTLTLALYATQTGGTALWTETHSSITLSGGHFSVLLGSVTSLNPDWTQPLWLGVQIGSEPELAPRQQITSVPLALTAEKLAVPVTTSTITDDAHTLVPQGGVLIWLGGTCPAGYSRVTAIDNKFLVSADSYNPTAGGSHTKDLSHTHDVGSYRGPSHTHGYVHGHDSIGNAQGAGGQCSNGDGGGCQTVNQSASSTSSDGTGSVTGTSAPGGSTSLDIRPAFATVLLCQKD